jgi:hypothetical protein
MSGFHQSTSLKTILLCLCFQRALVQAGTFGSCFWLTSRLQGGALTC